MLLRHCIMANSNRLLTCLPTLTSSCQLLAVVVVADSEFAFVGGGCRWPLICFGGKRLSVYWENRSNTVAIAINGKARKFRVVNETRRNGNIEIRNT